MRISFRRMTSRPSWRRRQMCPPRMLSCTSACLPGYAEGRSSPYAGPTSSGATARSGGRVHVRRSIYRGVVTSPKSTKSERLVDVPQRVLDVLEEQRVSSPALGTGYVFRTGTGTPLDPGSWYKRTFRQLCYRAGLRGSINLHSLRHTYASLLLRQGESLKYVSDQLGHASIQTTCDVYGHVLESQSQDAMARAEPTHPRCWSAPRTSSRPFHLTAI